MSRKRRPGLGVGEGFARRAGSAERGPAGAGNGNVPPPSSTLPTGGRVPAHELEGPRHPLARRKNTLSPVALGRKTVLWLNRSEGPSACSHSAWPMPSPTPPRDFHGPLRHPAVAFTSTGNQFSSTFISPSSAATPSTLLHPSGGLQPKYNGKPDSNRFKLTGSSLLPTTRSPKLKRFQD